MTIVGIATFGGEDGLGPSTFTAFTLAGAERHVTGVPGAVTGLLVQGADGVEPAELAAAAAAVLPDGVEAITGGALADETSDELDADFLGFLRTFLLVFAGVALLVATFSIYNTFSIIVAQRLRASALLRAVGADRRQVLGSMLAETLDRGRDRLDRRPVRRLRAGTGAEGGVRRLRLRAPDRRAHDPPDHVGRRAARRRARDGAGRRRPGDPCVAGAAARRAP